MDNKKGKYVPLKLWDCFCTPDVVHTSYFDCVMKATAWKMKVWSLLGKIQKHFSANYNFFEWMNPIKGL